MWQAHQHLFSCIQGEDEDIEDHFDCFENNAEVTESNGSELGIEDDSIQRDETFNNPCQAKQEAEENVEAARARTREKFLACGSLVGCGKKRFGKLTKDLGNNCAFGDDEHPSSMQKVHEHSMNHENTS